MKNQLFTPLTQKMIDENPTLSGNFLIDHSVTLEKMTLSRCYVFLKDGLLHNLNEPCLITDNLKTVLYMENGKYVENKVGRINYEFAGKMNGFKFIVPDRGEVKEIYMNPQEECHCISGPAVRHLLDSSLNEYYIHNKELNRKHWKKHPEVITYEKIKLKEKMDKTFQEEDK